MKLAPLLLALAVTAVPATAACAKDRHAFLEQGRWWGVNVSGMEFKDELPIKPRDIDFYADAGAKSIRLPVKRARLQTPDKLAALDALIRRGTARGMLMVIDEHSYGNIGDPDIRDFWLRMGRRYRRQPLVAFDLQNEPKGGTWVSWGPDARDLIHALRKAGIDNQLILEWRGWSGFGRADRGEHPKKACESALCSLNRAGIFTLADLDPLKRTWLSPHRYFNKGGSGATPECRPYPATGPLGNSVKAAQKLGMRLYVGEFAFGRAKSVPPTCKAMADDIVAFFRNTPEVVGGAAWGWGPRWSGNYLFRGESVGERDKSWDTENGRLIRSLWAN